MAGQPDNSHHFSSTASQAQEVAEGNAGDADAIDLRRESNLLGIPFQYSLEESTSFEDPL